MCWKYLFVIWLSTVAFISAQVKEPLDVVKKIGDRIIYETSFELADAKQKSAIDVQVVEFENAIGNKVNNSAFAFSKININEDTKLNFGISYSGPFKLWVNNKLLIQKAKPAKFFFKEIAYGLFTFMDSFSVDLKKGENRIVIESSLKGKPYIYLREITQSDESVKAKFSSLISNLTSTWPWIFIHSNKLSATYSQANFLDSLYSGKFKENELFVSPVRDLKKLVISTNSTFKKDSFADWNYPNGIMMMTLLNLAEASGDSRYAEFVNKYCDFVYDNIPLFKKQYFEDHDLRGSFHRIFRKSMLDDAGSPSFPFIQIAVNDNTKRHHSLVNEMTEYVAKRQIRLSDGTLCRPEPEEFTVWADDLFMSVPLLLRAAKIFNDKTYYDDAAKQIINFNKYLFDESKKLYKHGWFSKTKEKSKIFWGRANGWIIWAESEALIHLPKSHPAYKQIEKIFSEHLIGVLSYQDQSGMWHQILDDSTSFEETSCTAMFITGIVRGIINGTLDASLSDSVLKAWQSLLPKISSEGIVKDICCGTGIGYDDNFYKSRVRLDNDPRGLGAIITAGIEVNGLKKYLTKK
ncbi:MAG: glycoside hydrolase family 88 protein [Melioribacteraceae bacterium]